MKEILNRLIQHEVLSRQESKDILVGIANKAYNESEIASFLTVYMMRSIQLEGGDPVATAARRPAIPWS